MILGLPKLLWYLFILMTVLIEAEFKAPPSNWHQLDKNSWAKARNINGTNKRIYLNLTLTAEGTVEALIAHKCESNDVRPFEFKFWKLSEYVGTHYFCSGKIAGFLVTTDHWRLINPMPTEWSID